MIALSKSNLSDLDKITVSTNCAKTKATIESVSEDIHIVLTLPEKVHQEDDPKEEEEKGASKGKCVALVAEAPDSIHPNISTPNNKKASEKSPGEMPIATATPVTNLDVDLTNLDKQEPFVPCDRQPDPLDGQHIVAFNNPWVVADIYKYFLNQGKDIWNLCPHDPLSLCFSKQEVGCPHVAFLFTSVIDKSTASNSENKTKNSYATNRRIAQTFVHLKKFSKTANNELGDKSLTIFPVDLRYRSMLKT